MGLTMGEGQGERGVVTGVACPLVPGGHLARMCVSTSIDCHPSLPLTTLPVHSLSTQGVQMSRLSTSTNTSTPTNMVNLPKYGQVLLIWLILPNMG